MRLTHDIHIDAHPALVWDVTLAIEGWPSWTPTIRSVQRRDGGPLSVGSTALLRQPGLPAATWTVTRIEPGELFEWSTRVLGMDMIAAHELTPHAGGTRNILRLDISGLVATLLRPFVARSCLRALAQENAGLKRHCEQAARD